MCWVALQSDAGRWPVLCLLFEDLLVRLRLRVHLFSATARDFVAVVIAVATLLLHPSPHAMPMLLAVAVLSLLHLY